jgi:hypothetical protein
MSDSFSEVYSLLSLRTVRQTLTNIEWIDSIPALGTKLSAFINNSMEVTEDKQHCLEFSFLAAHFQRLLVEIVKCLVQIRQHTRRQFIGDFDG